MMQARKTWFRCLAILAAAGTCGLLFNLAAPQGIGLLAEEVARPLWTPVELAEAERMQKAGALFVDARDVDHYQVARVRGAVSLSPAEWSNLYPLLRSTLVEAPAVVVYGLTYSQFPAAVTAQRLKQEGIDRVYVLEQSLEALRGAGFPISEPRRRNR